MSSQAGPRMDYLRLWVDAKRSVVRDVYDLWVDASVKASDLQPDALRQVKVSWLPGRDADHDRVALEAWGETADIMAVYLPFSLHIYVTRIDVKFPICGLEPHEVREATHLLYDFSYGRASRSLYDTPSRSKSGGRSGGGVGFAFGSHKSSRRFNFYSKKKERPTCEVAYSGQHLHRSIDEVALLVGETYDQDLHLICTQMAYDAILYIQSITRWAYNSDMGCFEYRKPPIVNKLTLPMFGKVIVGPDDKPLIYVDEELEEYPE
jgi:hypothetical protein